MISWAFNPWAMPKDGHVRITIAITVRKPNTVAHVHHMNECPSNIQVRDVSFEKNKCLPTCDNLCFLIALVSFSWVDTFSTSIQVPLFPIPCCLPVYATLWPSLSSLTKPDWFRVPLWYLWKCDEANGCEWPRWGRTYVSVYGTLRDSTALLM